MKTPKRIVCEGVEKEKGTGFYIFKKCLNEKGGKIGDVYITNLGEFKAKGKLKKAIDEVLKK